MIPAMQEVNVALRAFMARSAFHYLVAQISVTLSLDSNDLSY